MKTCKICGNPKSTYVLNNRLVCMKCDDLVFDLEIECEEEPSQTAPKGNDKEQKLKGLKKTNIPAKN
jgi:hypothetical protein